MSRRKDSDKRQVILGEAKRLFAEKGFDNTSMGSLALGIGIPVGSVYTYFDSKESLLATIIEEGWGEFASFLENGIAEAIKTGLARNPRTDTNLIKLAYLVKAALPELFKDLDLIAILLAQAGRASRLEEKLDYLTGFVSSIVLDYQQAQGRTDLQDRAVLKTGLAVMLLGSLESMRLIFHAGIDIAAGDVIAFLVSTVEAALGCALPELFLPSEVPVPTIQPV